MTKTIKRQSQVGQAMVEYLVMVAVALSLVIALNKSFKRSLLAVWGYYIRQVSAPCPGCPPDTRYQFR